MLVVFPLLAILLMPSLWLILGRPRFLTARIENKSHRAPKVSVIIPARNEEKNLPHLLNSFRKSSSQPHEIIVVDDGSTDATARIARELAAHIITPEPPPEGWKGKPWACQSGAQAATGDWLLFLDADTWFEPEGYQQILPLADEQESVSSICPYHRIETPVEELSAFFNLIMVAGSNAFGIPADTRNNSALFGQSLLLPKNLYQESGGHEKVKSEILENFHLAEHLHKQGIPRHCYLGKNVLSMRMFDGGLSELWGSWKKGFTSGAKQAHPRALILISLWLTAGMTALVSMMVAFFTLGPSGLFLTLSLVAYLLFALQCCWVFRLVGNFSPFNALFFPISLCFYQILFFTALIAKKRGLQTEWKGRDVS